MLNVPINSRFRFQFRVRFKLSAPVAIVSVVQESSDMKVTLHGKTVKAKFHYAIWS